MSGNPKIIVGELLPLSWSTVDGATGLSVIASIVDCYGKQHGSTKLNEVSKGVYTNIDFLMPDVPFVIVQYFPDDDTYEIAQERFDSQPKASEPVKYVDGRVTKRSPVGDYKVGEVL